MATVQRKISDKEIERCLADTTITEINAIGVPFVVRIHANRETASWYLVSYKDGKTKRTKLANWPDLRTKQVLAQKDELIGKLALGDAPTLNEWQSVGDLLTWYRDRTVTNTTLNKKTRYDTKSIIDKHLLPMLGSENIAALTPALLETELIWPLQSCYALGTVKQYFSKLKRAFKVATRQKRLAFNPISEVIFKDFFDVKIKGKPSALLPKDLPMVVPLLSIQTALERLPGLMLLHGTRIGETRQLRWEFIDWYNATLTIPEALTKGSAPELVIPLTDYALTWLKEHHRLLGLTGYRGPYLFPSTSKRGPLDEGQATEIIQKVSQKRWQSHDLRKLARTMWIQLDVDYWVCERLLNHVMAKLDESYIHTTAEAQKRAALERWHAELVTQTQRNHTDTIPTWDEMNEPADALR